MYHAWTKRKELLGDDANFRSFFSFHGSSAAFSGVFFYIHNINNLLKKYDGSKQYILRRIDVAHIPSFNFS